MNGAAKTGSITVEKDNNMLINRKINPLLEALQYYNRRVNGTSVSDTMIRLENAYPERVHEIHSTVAPILDLDNLLSAELVPEIRSAVEKEYPGYTIQSVTHALLSDRQAYKVTLQGSGDLAKVIYMLADGTIVVPKMQD